MFFTQCPKQSYNMIYTDAGVYLQVRSTHLHIYDDPLHRNTEYWIIFLALKFATQHLAENPYGLTLLAALKCTNDMHGNWEHTH